MLMTMLMTMLTTPMTMYAHDSLAFAAMHVTQVEGSGRQHL